MSRPILDPREAIRFCGARVQSWQNCPPPARQFGFAPTHEDLLVGDLILVAPIRRGLTARIISWSQRQFYTDNLHTMWTHAAIYVGDGEIIEATDKGVFRAHLGKYVHSHLVLVRRNPELTDKQRFRIALRAYWHVRRAYSRAIAFDIFIYALRARIFPNRPNHKFEVPASRVICSILYNKCYFYACDNSCIADKATDYYISPAHLSATSTLRDANVSWSRIQ